MKNLAKNEEMAIICVDDEQVVLTGLSAQLGRIFGKEYVLEMAQSGEEALEILQEFLEEGTDVPLVITDQIMPGLKGNELMAKVKDVSANTRCILLTGQAAAEEVGDAANQGNLYRYIAKPWDRTDLILTVQEALKSYNQHKEIEEKRIKLKKYAEHLEDMVVQRTQELEEEKEKADKLLLNILPVETATELKETGKSRPRKYQQVTILFTDFVGFSRHAALLDPAQLVHSLEECFLAFDEIIGFNHLEKIKTIGDAYMCAGGIPKENTTNA